MMNYVLVYTKCKDIQLVLKISTLTYIYLLGQVPFLEEQKIFVLPVSSYKVVNFQPGTQCVELVQEDKMVNIDSETLCVFNIDYVVARYLTAFQKKNMSLSYREEMLHLSTCHNFGCYTAQLWSNYQFLNTII